MILMAVKTKKDEALDIIYGLLLVAADDLKQTNSPEDELDIKGETIFCIEGIVALYEPTEVLPYDWKELSWNGLNALVSRLFNEIRVFTGVRQMPLYCV